MYDLIGHYVDCAVKRHNSKHRFPSEARLACRLATGDICRARLRIGLRYKKADHEKRNARDHNFFFKKADSLSFGIFGFPTLEMVQLTKYKQATHLCEWLLTPKV